MFDREELLEIVSGRKSGVRASATRLVLGCLTPLYRTIVGIKNWRFDRAAARADSVTIKHAHLPVVSVGNLTTGGTGKTPHVIWIAKYLRNQKRRVVLISRGYGGERSAGTQSRNDEAMELELRLPDVPHLQDPDRYRMSQIAIEEFESEIIVLDDAFQHRKFHRDLDVVLIDATLPFGFGRLLPRGLLREPINSLRRADLVILTRSNLVSKSEKQQILKRIHSCGSDVPIAQSQTVVSSLLQSNGRRIAVDELDLKPVFSFCGIGNPEGFRRTLGGLGLDVQGTLVFPDHHVFSRDDLAQIAQQAADVGAVAVVCTHKDLVKIGTNQIGGRPLYAILIDVEFTSGQQDLEQQLDRLLT